MQPDTRDDHHTSRISGSRAPKGDQADKQPHIGYLLMTLARTLHGMTRAAMEPSGLVPRQFGLLRTVCQMGPSTQRELGRRMSIDRTTMVQFTDHLESLGLVERRHDPEDRRAYAVTPTRKGTRLARKLASTADAVQQQFLEPLSPNEQKQLVRVLQKLMVHNAHHIEEHLAGDRPLPKD
ncbi:MAG: MarR family transcriptional regulator [Planctomycetota bacterium]